MNLVVTVDVIEQSMQKMSKFTSVGEVQTEIASLNSYEKITAVEKLGPLC